MLAIFLQVLLYFLLLGVQPMNSVPLLITPPDIPNSSNSSNHINKTNINNTEKTIQSSNETAILKSEINKKEDKSEIKNKEFIRTKSETNNIQNKDLFWEKILEEYGNKDSETFVNNSRKNQNILRTMSRRDLTRNYKRSYEEIQHGEKEHFITKRDTTVTKIKDKEINVISKKDNVISKKERNDKELADNETPLPLQPNALLNKNNTSNESDSEEMFNTAETKWGGRGGGGFGGGWGFSGGGGGWGHSGGGGGCIKCVKPIPVVIAVKPIMVPRFKKRPSCGHPRCNRCGKK